VTRRNIFRAASNGSVGTHSESQVGPPRQLGSTHCGEELHVGRLREQPEDLLGGQGVRLPGSLDVVEDQQSSLEVAQVGHQRVLRVIEDTRQADSLQQLADEVASRRSCLAPHEDPAAPEALHHLLIVEHTDGEIGFADSRRPEDQLGSRSGLHQVTDQLVSFLRAADRRTRSRQPRDHVPPGRCHCRPVLDIACLCPQAGDRFRDLRRHLGCVTLIEHVEGV
jgi:hypothetical protein